MVTVSSSIKIVNITIEENTKQIISNHAKSRRINLMTLIFIVLQIHNNILKYRKFPKKIKIETNKKTKVIKPNHEKNNTTCLK